MEAIHKTVFDDFEEGFEFQEGADVFAKEMIEIEQGIIDVTGGFSLENLLGVTLEILLQDSDLEKFDDSDTERSKCEILGFALLTGVAIGLRVSKINVRNKQDDGPAEGD